MNDTPSWLTGRRSWTDRSYSNGWWWGRHGNGTIHWSTDYDWAAWSAGYTDGRDARGGHHDSLGPPRGISPGPTIPGPTSG